MSATQQQADIPFGLPADEAMRALIKRVKGGSPGPVELRATVGLLPAGQKEHWSGGMIQVFQPVALRVEFVQPPDEAVVAAVVYRGDKVVMGEGHYLEVQKDFDAQLVLEGRLAGEPALVGAAGRLFRELVSSHREITGKVTGAYQRIENEPAEIGRIMRERIRLQIDLDRLTQYKELSARHFDTIFVRRGADARARADDLQFQQCMLQQPFVDAPCTRDQFDQLQRSWRAEDMAGSVTLPQYYEWYQRSQAMLDGNGEFGPDSRQPIERAIRAWHETWSKDEAAFDDHAYKWASRNFEVHPMHRPALTRLIGEVVEAIRAQPSSPAPRP